MRAGFLQPVRLSLKKTGYTEKKNTWCAKPPSRANPPTLQEWPRATRPEEEGCCPHHAATLTRGNSQETSRVLFAGMATATTAGGDADMLDEQDEIAMAALMANLPPNATAGVTQAEGQVPNATVQMEAQGAAAAAQPSRKAALAIAAVDDATSHNKKARLATDSKWETDLKSANETLISTISIAAVVPFQHMRVTYDDFMDAFEHVIGALAVGLSSATFSIEEAQKGVMQALKNATYVGGAVVAGAEGSVHRVVSIGLRKEESPEGKLAAGLAQLMCQLDTPVTVPDETGLGVTILRFAPYPEVVAELSTRMGDVSLATAGQMRTGSEYQISITGIPDPSPLNLRALAKAIELVENAGHDKAGAPPKEVTYVRAKQRYPTSPYRNPTYLTVCLLTALHLAPPRPTPPHPTPTQHALPHRTSLCPTPYYFLPGLTDTDSNLVALFGRYDEETDAWAASGRYTGDARIYIKGDRCEYVPEGVKLAITTNEVQAGEVLIMRKTGAYTYTHTQMCLNCGGQVASPSRPPHTLNPPHRHTTPNLHPPQEDRTTADGNIRHQADCVKVTQERDLYRAARSAQLYENDPDVDGPTLKDTRDWIKDMREHIHKTKPAWATTGKALGVRTCTTWNGLHLDKKAHKCGKSNCKFLPCIFIKNEFPKGWSWARVAGRGGNKAIALMPPSKQPPRLNPHPQGPTRVPTPTPTNPPQTTAGRPLGRKPRRKRVTGHEPKRARHTVPEGGSHPPPDPVDPHPAAPVDPHPAVPVDPHPAQRQRGRKRKGQDGTREKNGEQHAWGEQQEKQHRKVPVHRKRAFWVGVRKQRASQGPAPLPPLIP